MVEIWLAAILVAGDVHVGQWGTEDECRMAVARAEAQAPVEASSGCVKVTRWPS